MKLKAVHRKYIKRIVLYTFILLAFVLIGYGAASVVSVPAEFIILPLVTSIAGTMCSARVNRLLDSISFFTPQALLEENDKVLQNAELRIEELKAIDEKNKNDRFERVIAELENNVSICQGINERESNSSFVTLFIRDIKTLMKIPAKSLAEHFAERLDKIAIRKKRDEAIAKAKALLTPYDSASRERLADFITELAHQVFPVQAHSYQMRVKPILLVGPPGIGKTFLLYAIAQIFHMAVAKVEMGNFNLVEFEGKQMPGSAGLPTSQPGVILQTLTNPQENRSGTDDIMVILDEIDKGFIKEGGDGKGMSKTTASVVGFLHPLLQTDLKTFKDKGYNIPLSARNVVVALTSNRNCFEDSYLDKTTSESLIDRVKPIIKMPPLLPNAKRDILAKKIDPIVLADAETNEKEKLIAGLFMRRKLEMILVEEADTPGLRSCLKKITLAFEDSFDGNLDSRMGCKSIAQLILEMSQEYAARVEDAARGFDIHIDATALTTAFRNKKHKGKNAVPGTSPSTGSGSYSILISEDDSPSNKVKGAANDKKSSTIA